MAVLNDFRIPYVGLKPGMHAYDFKLDHTFFEEFETSEVQRGDLQIHVDLDRKENMLVLQVDLKGEVETLCDRCQEALTIPLDQAFELIVKFGEQRGHTDEEFLVLGPQDHEVDLAQYFYEYVHLAMPTRCIHQPPNDCDPKILEILDQYSYGNDDEEEETDPRWEALKKLKGGSQTD